LARNVVEKRNVNSYAALGLSKPKPGLIGRLKGWFGSSVTAPDDPLEPTPARARAFANVLSSKVEADVVPNTNLIQLSYTAEDRGIAKEICSVLSMQFAADEQERRKESRKRSRQWIHEMREEFEVGIKASEQQLRDILRDTNAGVASDVPDVTRDQRSHLQDSINTLRARQAGVRVRLYESAARLQSLDNAIEASNDNGEGADIVRSLELLTELNAVSLVTQRADLRRELATMRIQYGPKHPSIKGLEKAIALVEEEIRSQAHEAIQAARHAHERTVAEERSLQEEIDASEKMLSAINRHRDEYFALQDKIDADRAMFKVIVEAQSKANASMNLDTVDISPLSDEPFVNPARTNVLRSLLIALFLGLLAGVGAALFADYMDTSVATPADVDRALGLERLAVIVHSRAKTDDDRALVLAARDDPHSTVTENFRSLRANILYSPRFKGARCLVVTSSVAGEGKTTVVSNLAVVLAQAGKKVLLIDGDMRRPTIDKVFGIPQKPGFSEVLNKKIGLDEALCDPGIENLRVVSSGSPPSKPAELIGSAGEALMDLVRRSEQFDFILLDSPPASVSDSAQLAKSFGGTVLLVIRSGAVSDEIAKGSIEKLRNVDIPVAGVVLNDFDLKKQGYYGYGYQSYGYYYGGYRGHSDSPEEQDVEA